MKRIGLLGGMSWESSIVYYQLVNEAVRARLGGLHSADCLLRSVDFAGVEELRREGRWDEAADVWRTNCCTPRKRSTWLFVDRTRPLNAGSDQSTH